MSLLTQPWPWYVSGPLIGLMIPILLLIDNKAFGISSSMRHICAACFPGNIKFFNYDWKAEKWNLMLVFGVIIGGFIAGFIFPNPNPILLNEKTVQHLTELGVTNFNGLSPVDLFNFNSLLSLKGFIIMIVGGFFVGFGTRYAGGCTSGHAIMGISNLQLPSFIATCCFFIGGLLMTWIILPFILKL